MKKIIIFIFVIIFSKNLYSEQKNEVLFTIKNYPFTSIDLNQRKNYLELFYGTNNIFDKDSSFLNDLISVSLFNEFAIDKNIKINKDTLENYYNAIIKQYEDRNSSKFIDSKFYTTLPKKIILKNIRLDLQRKNILEEILKNNNIDYLSTKEDINILDIFDINLNYLIVNKEFLSILKNININLNNNNIEDIMNLFERKQINYKQYIFNVSEMKKIDLEIQEHIINDSKEFIINKNNYILIGKIKKNLKKNIGVKYSFYQIKSKKKESLIDLKFNCENIENIQDNVDIEITKFEKIEVEKLNLDVIEKLTKRNDAILIENNDKKHLIILCNIEIDSELAKKVSKEENIQNKADRFENEFIANKKKEYNFQLY